MAGFPSGSGAGLRGRGLTRHMSPELAPGVRWPAGWERFVLCLFFCTGLVQKHQCYLVRTWIFGLFFIVRYSCIIGVNWLISKMSCFFFLIIGLFWWKPFFSLPMTSLLCICSLSYSLLYTLGFLCSFKGENCAGYTMNGGSGIRGGWILLPCTYQTILTVQHRWATKCSAPPLPALSLLDRSSPALLSPGSCCEK